MVAVAGEGPAGVSDLSERPERRFYVYAVAVGGRIAYIGKGTGRRAWSHLGRRCKNSELKAQIAEARQADGRIAVRLLRTGLTEREAYALERALIVRNHERLANRSIGQTTWAQRFSALLRADLASLVSEASCPEEHRKYLHVIKARLRRLLAAADEGLLGT